nr:hypothetical protein Itr_chr04CG21930 [Ipomoea trifida]
MEIGTFKNWVRNPIVLARNTSSPTRVDAGVPIHSLLEVSATALKDNNGSTFGFEVASRKEKWKRRRKKREINAVVFSASPLYCVKAKSK